MALIHTNAARMGGSWLCRVHISPICLSWARDQPKVIQNLSNEVLNTVNILSVPAVEGY